MHRYPAASLTASARLTMRMARLLLTISLACALLVTAGSASASAAGGGRYVAVTPARVLDTRAGIGAPTGQLQAGRTLGLTVAGNGGLPVTGATAVVLNVTVTEAPGPGFLTLWPAGQPLPVASNLNFTAGQTVANLVEVGVGSGGQVSFYASGTVSVIADVEGWVSASTSGPGLFNPVTPARLLDTRAPAATLGPGGVASVPVLNRAGVPAAGVSAVVLNLTATNGTGPGHLTAWPHGLTRPLASNLNFSAGQTVANRAMVAVGTGGMIDVGNATTDRVDVVVDIAGWFTDATGSAGATYFGLTPARILDTRSSGLPLRGGGVRSVQIAGHGGVPVMGVAGAPTAVVANVTATNTWAASYLTVWPEGSPMPLASDLNWQAGATVPNLVVVALGPSGAIDVYNSAGNTDVIVDVVGYYVGPPLPPPASGSTMANLINQDRANAGLPALQWSTCLASVAQGESVRQANQGAISHAGGVNLDLACGYTRAGENVGYTSGGIDDAQLNTLFMNSPGHRANILDPNFRYVGTAWVVAANGYGYVTEEFAG